MTKYKGLKLSLAGIFTAALVTACGTDGSVLNSALDGNNLQDLAYRVEGTGAQFGKSQFGQGQFGKGQMGHGMREGFQKGGVGQKGFAPQGADIFAELDLSDAQKTELQALRESLRPEQTERPDEAQRTETKALIEAAFVSDSFEVAALEESLAASKPDASERLSQQAEFIIASWNILTDEQKVLAKTKQAEREENFTEKAEKMAAVERPERPEKTAFDGASRLTELLSLNAEQSAALSALHENKPERPEPQAMRVQTQATHAAIQAELDKTSPSTDAIVAILEANRPEEQASPLDKLADLHSILNAEQRQAFVDAGLTLGNKGPEGGHGGPQMDSKMGRNGQGGHPGRQPMGGHPGFAGGGFPQN